jgi:hypothetical protein
MAAVTAAAPALVVERCRHDMFPASSCSLCHPELEPDHGPALRPYAVLEAFHRSWCRNCEGWIEKGDPCGFVKGVGVCCAHCCGLGGDS